MALKRYGDLFLDPKKVLFASVSPGKEHGEVGAIGYQGNGAVAMCIEAAPKDVRLLLDDIATKQSGK